MKGMKISGCALLFLCATMVYSSAGSLCGEHDGYREFVWDSSIDTSEPNNITEYNQNLDLLWDHLNIDPSQTSMYGWYGVPPNAPYFLGRCIGYINNHTSCLSCLQDAKAMIRNDCSEKAMSAILWYKDECMVRYSNHDMGARIQMPDNMIFIKNDTGDVEPPSSVAAFDEARMKLFNELTSKAKSGSGGDLNNQMFAVGKWYDGTSNQTIYGAAQCSWDLGLDKPEQCSPCLAIVGQKLGQYFDGKAGGSIVGPSCNFQYEVYNFFANTSLVMESLSPSLPPNGPQPASDLQTPLHPGKGSNKSILLVIYVVAPLVIISIIFFVGMWVFSRKKTKKKNKKPTTEYEIGGRTSDEDESSSIPYIKTEETLQYDFSFISTATGNFSEACKLGQGGFGIVYKGKLQNGDEIAVKRLSQSSKQGELEFINEVTLLAKLQHRNLVRLLGFCLKRKERVLIYEFVANSSLDNYIFDPVKRAHLKWVQLYKIIGGVARGLLYLHEDSRLRIIHRDLKSSNILLDNEMTPKIADFGLARLFLNEETHGSTSKIVGTYGYMAPEYLMHGQFSFKSDIFSFGVLLLEIICGRRNSSFRIGNSVENLLSYAWKNWEEGTVSNLIDPTLILETSSISEMTRGIHIGLLCAQEDATQRPTMASVVNMLSNLSTALDIPSKPFFQQYNISQETPLLQDYNSGMTSNSSGSKHKSRNTWTADTELSPR